MCGDSHPYAHLSHPSRLDVQKGNPNKGGDVPTNLCKHFKKLLY